MVNIQRELIADIREALESAIKDGALVFDMGNVPIVVKRTEDALHGHYSSPLSLALAKIAQKSPLEIAGIISTHMPKREYIDKVEVAAPGFLNITIQDTYLASRLDNLPNDDFRSACNVGNNKTINMEFISANPTGPLTLGNARTAFSADTLGSVMEYAGYNVIREYYINDAGEQIQKLGESVLRRILEQQGLTVDFAEDLYQGEYIIDIAKNIAEEYTEEKGKTFQVSDLDNVELLAEISTKAMHRCLAAIKQTIHNDLHIDFDVWTSERQVRESGEIEKVIGRLKEKNLMYEKDGAQFIKTTEFGDDKDRVMIKANGAYAYITPDVAYHQLKFDREFDMIFTYLGADHQGHIPKLKAALEALGNDTKKLHMIVAQWLEIVQGGKQVALSKRRGNVYSLKELIDEIGYDAARFFMIEHALESHMVLDLDVAKEKSDANPVYYVQYAYVRLEAIIRKAKVSGVIPYREVADEVPPRVTITHQSERELALQLFAFPEVIESIASSFGVHQLARYAYDLARAVNAFYRDVQVLNGEDEATIKSRLQIVVAAHAILGNVIDLLGISKPDVM
ncbi:MAG: arginine--tRNA ligase [bacterium]|nr:arginine--tRNA ligase [bacterium]